VLLSNPLGHGAEYLGVTIAYRGDLDAGNRGERLKMVSAASAQADHAHADGVVGGVNTGPGSGWQTDGGSAASRGLEETAAVQVVHERWTSC
jgi:hypothetical protein